MENKDTNYRVGVGVTPASEKELVSRIKGKALELAADANHYSTYTRKVSTQAVLTVVDRSLYANKAFSYSVKEHNALKDVSEFIALAQRNKVVNFSVLDHTDLLPIAHPRSTQEHDMHPIALEKEQAKWFTNIEGLTNETRGLVASALTADLNSAEYQYATTRLDSMAEGSIPAEAMFGWRDGIFSGGNSRIARSMRARIQNRDSKGQFAEMFGAAMAWIRSKAGAGYRKLTGRTVGGDDQGFLYIESKPGKVTRIPTNKTSSAGKAYIFDKTKQDIVLNSIKSDDVSAEENEITEVDAAPGWNKVEGYNGPGEQWTDGAYNLVKFDAPSPETRKRIDSELARAKELDLADPKQIKLGEDGKFYDPDYPLFEISRAKGNKRPFGYAQSWADVQLLAKQDTDAYDRDTSSSPEAKRSPRTAQDIDDYQYPEGFYRLGKDVKHTPTGPDSGKSDNYTDDPVALANMFDEQELTDLLRKAVTPDKGSEVATGVASVIFDPENQDIVDDIPAEAIYKALDQATGGEARYELAKIYDEGLGSNANTESLEAAEAVKPEAKPRAKKKKTETAPPTEEAAPEETYVPPLLRGLSDDELSEFKESGEYRNYLPKNEEFEIPDGYSSLDPDPVSEAEINRVTDAEQSDVFPAGWDDSPLNIAKNYSSEDLKEQLKNAVSPDNENAGQGLISLPTDDGDSFTGAVSAEKIRDALQLQGEDTNEILGQIYKSGMQAPESDSKTKLTPPEVKEQRKGWRRTLEEIRFYLTQERNEEELPEKDYRKLRELADDLDDLIVDIQEKNQLQPLDYDYLETLKNLKKKLDKKSNWTKDEETENVLDIVKDLVNGAISQEESKASPEKPKAVTLPTTPATDKTSGTPGTGDGDGGEPPKDKKPVPSDQPEGPRAISVPSASLKKGDVAYQTLVYESTDEVDEFGNPVKYSFPSYFTLDEDADPTNTITVESSKGPLTKVSVKGHFPGGPTQEKFWGEDSLITVIRGLPEDQLPPVGDLPELHVPKPKDEKYGDQGQYHPDYMPDRKKYQRDMAERSDLWSAPEGLDLAGKKEKLAPVKPKESISKPKKPREPRKSPFLSAFTEKAREIAKIKATNEAGKKARWEEFKKFFDAKEITYFDTETTGLEEDDRVFQISITKATGRTKGETLTLWINPEKPLDPAVVAKLNQKDGDGNPLTDEWLQKNGMSYEEAGRQIAEFVGQDATLAAYNSPFDVPHMRKLYEAAGEDYDANIAEVFDVLAFADKVQMRDKDQAYREETWNEEFQRMERPRALTLKEQAIHFGLTYENAHDAAADTDAAIHVANSVLDRAVETGQNATVFDIDKQQASYDKEMDTYREVFKKYESDLEAFNAAREADKKDPVADTSADPNGPSTTAGNNPETEEIIPNTITPESNVDRPVGQLSDMDPEWINDDANTTAMDLAAEDLQPGDYVTVNGRQQRVDAIRVGASHGVEDGDARVTFTDVESGRQFTGNISRDKAFTGVRRPNDPRSVQVDPEATKDDQGASLSPKSEVTDLNDRPVSVQDREKVPTRQKFTLGDNTGVIEIYPTEDGEFLATGAIYDADGNVLFKTEGTYLSYDGASKEMELATRRGFINQTKADRRDQLEFDFDNASDDTEISKGDEPAYDVDHEEVFDTQYGQGKVTITKLVDKTGRTWYVMNASGFDQEGEFIDETQEVFSNKEEAIAYGRRWLANSSNVKQNQRDAENPGVEVVDEEDVNQEENLIPESESKPTVDVDGTEVPSKVPFWEQKRRQRGKHRKPKQPSKSSVERAERKEAWKHGLPRPDSSLPKPGKGAYMMNVDPSDLQKGDVMYPDGFTIMNVEQMGRHLVYTGFYPDGRIQNLIEYNAANKSVRVIRNLNKKDRPVEGDNPPIMRPNPTDYPGGRQNPDYQADRRDYIRQLSETRQSWSVPKNIDEYTYVIDMDNFDKAVYGFIMYYGRFDDKMQAQLNKRYQKLVKVNGNRLSERGLPSDFDEAVPGIPVYIPVDKNGPKPKPKPTFIDDLEDRRPANPGEPGWDTSRLNPDNQYYDPRFMGAGEGEAFLAIKMENNDQEAWNVFAQDYWDTNMVLPNGQPIGPMPASFPEELRRELGRPEFTERPQEGAVLRTRDGVSTWVNPDGSTAPFNPEDPTQGVDETDGRIYGSDELAGGEVVESPVEPEEEAPTAPPAPPVAQPTPEKPEDVSGEVVTETPVKPTVKPSDRAIPKVSETQKREFEERRRVINETTTRDINNYLNRSADGVEVLEVGDLVYHYDKLTDGQIVYGRVVATGLKAYGNLVYTTKDVLDYRGKKFKGYVQIQYFDEDGNPIMTTQRRGDKTVQVPLGYKRAARNNFVVQKWDGRIPENSPLATGESIEDLKRTRAIPGDMDVDRSPELIPSTPTPEAPKARTSTPSSAPSASSNAVTAGKPSNVRSDKTPGVSGWEDVDGVVDSQSSIPNNKQFESGIAQFSHRKADEDPEKLSGVDSVQKYVKEILYRYGYGIRRVPVVADGKKIRGAAAAVSWDPSIPVDERFPTVIIKKTGQYSKPILLHEVAHIMSAAWKLNDRSGGHSMTWYDTYMDLLRGEGFNNFADELEASTGVVQSDKSVLTKLSTPPEVEKEVEDLQSNTNKETYSAQEAIDLSGSDSSALDKLSMLLNGTDEDPYALFESVDLDEKNAVISDIGVPVKSLYTDVPLSSDDPLVNKYKNDYIQGADVKPVLVVERDGKLYVASGLERAQAAYELGLDNIPAVIIPSSKPGAAYSEKRFYSFGEIPESNDGDYTLLAIQAAKSEDAREKVVSSIIEALEAGVVPWQKPWSSGGIIPLNGKTDKQYSALNTLALWLAGQQGELGDRAEAEGIAGVPFSTNIWLGYNQAKELGGQVKRGSKGTSILYPVIKNVEVKDPVTGEVKTEKKLIGYGETKVFNLDQIDGLENLRPTEKDPVSVSDGEAALLEAYKDAPPVKNTPQDEAYYSPTEDAIYLPNRSQFDTPVGYFETLAHEFIHSTGHKDRLDRTDLTKDYGTHRASRAEEELIAEIGTAILAAMLGVDLDINQPASYVASWLKALQDDRSMILKAASAAQKAADYVMQGANLGAYGKSGEEIAREDEEK